MAVWGVGELDYRHVGTRMRANLSLAGAIIGSVIFLLAVGNVPAIGQAGSTGGFVGNRNKTVSGSSEEQPASRGPSRHSGSPPKASGGCGPVMGSWLWNNGVTVVVNSNNTTTQSDGHSATVVCAGGIYTFTWFGFPSRMTLSSDGKRLSGTNALGSTSAARQ